MRTYYDVLGVAADTPDVVIKAAFRALAKEYHPDRAQADSGDTDRFIEIQTAYAVLSKPESRSLYDSELQEAFLSATHQPASASATGGMPAPAPWSSTRHNTAEIERICARLSLYSEPLAQSFYESCLRGECGDDPWRFARELESGFFKEYFGDDPDVQAFARLLLLGSRTGAALTLNQLVAGGASPPVKDLRGILAAVLDQHFPDEALFTEWLKVKFGVLPVQTRKEMEAESLELASTSGGAAVPSAASGVPPPPQAARARRPVALVFMWAIALYFVLFAALPTIQ